MGITEKTKLSLPVATFLAAAIAVASAGTTYGVYKTNMESQRAEVQRVEHESKERDARVERRIEKLENVAEKTQLLLERIDERTTEIKRQLDLK